MKTIVFIPARLGSTRLQNIVLPELKGKMIVQRAYEQCIRHKILIKDVLPQIVKSLKILEQLRILENEYKIKMIGTDYNSIGIDTEEDYKKTKALQHDI